MVKQRDWSTIAHCEGLENIRRAGDDGRGGRLDGVCAVELKVSADAILFVGWEKQLFWRALRRPPGQVQVSLPLCLNLEEVPVGASRIPLLRELGVQALGRAST